MREHEPATRSQKLKLKALACTALEHYHQAAHAETSVTESDGEMELTLTVRPVEDATEQTTSADAAPSLHVETPRPATAAARRHPDFCWHELCRLAYRFARRQYGQTPIGISIRFHENSGDAVLPLPALAWLEELEKGHGR